ncbi:hypothetical protein SKAU_G00015160 [Synaphobranchus kaupii]|uniref:Uncharacterized protein n=1 Tax=Synaphobranchus kaupii TaxID=118154 RepID=A0A9Q1GBS4_SYNKA|nr:hypothetical protein SKAU_G00015160 [Synaphobranchus kaupii]
MPSKRRKHSRQRKRQAQKRAQAAAQAGPDGTPAEPLVANGGLAPVAETSVQQGHRKVAAFQRPVVSDGVGFLTRPGQFAICLIWPPRLGTVAGNRIWDDVTSVQMSLTME